MGNAPSGGINENDDEDADFLEVKIALCKFIDEVRWSFINLKLCETFMHYS